MVLAVAELYLLAI